MSTKTIFTIGFELPTKSFEYKKFHSRTSLLDADIILFKPVLDYQMDYLSSTFEGKPNLSDTSSVQCKESIKHWSHEISMAFENGKTIFIYLNTPEDVFINTGNTLSGTGRSIKTVKNVTQINSYNMLPFKFTDKRISKGKNIKFTQDGNLLKGYWETVKEISEYELFFAIEDAKPLLQTKTGDKTVGAIIKNEKGGVILLLPPLNLPESFTKLHVDGKTYIWTEKALQFSKSLLSQIISIDKTLKYSTDETPEPEWISEEQFQLDIEKKHLSEIEKLEKQINSIQAKIESKKRDLKKNTLSKKLLYENGKALEYALIDALETIGFKAVNYDDGKSEFDIVFESAEGRFIGEAEGKDNSAIAITKFRQLESNIHEDFERDEVTQHAKGVLFGNPFRLIHPNMRKEFFTQKALDSAKRTGIALVNTHELFEIVKYIKQSKNKVYAKQVRECFRDTVGEIIKFPSIVKEDK